MEAAALYIDDSDLEHSIDVSADCFRRVRYPTESRDGTIEFTVIDQVCFRSMSIVPSCEQGVIAYQTVDKTLIRESQLESRCEGEIESLVDLTNIPFTIKGNAQWRGCCHPFFKEQKQVKESHDIVNLLVDYYRKIKKFCLRPRERLEDKSFLLKITKVVYLPPEPTFRNWKNWVEKNSVAYYDLVIKEPKSLMNFRMDALLVLKSVRKKKRSSDDGVEDKDKCTICLENFCGDDSIFKLIMLSCNHVFHERCIIKWLWKNDTCPNCREEVPEIQ